MPTPPVPALLPTQKNLYLSSLPVMNLAEAPLQRTSCIQQRSIPLLDIVSTTSDDLPLIVPTFKVAILHKDLRGISHDEDLTSPRFLALPLTTLSTLLFPALSSLNYLLCTTIFNLKQTFYGWMPFLSPTTASQLQENADLSQNLKSAVKIKPYPRITTLNNTSKGVLNFLLWAAHTRPDVRAPSVTPEGESGEYDRNVELTCSGEAIYFAKALYPFKVRHHPTITHLHMINIYICFYKADVIRFD